MLTQGGFVTNSTLSFSNSEEEIKVVMCCLKHFCCSPFTSLLSHSCQKRVCEWEEFHTSLCWGITVGNEVWTRSSTSFCHKEWEGAHCSTRRLWTVFRRSQPSASNYRCQLNRIKTWTLLLYISLWRWRQRDVFLWWMSCRFKMVSSRLAKRSF